MGNQERQSNIELLRIVSMFLICLHHVCVHGPWWSLGGDTAHETVAYVLGFGGKLGVDLFVLITGYFMVTSSFKSKSLLRIVLQTIFYSILLAIIFAIGKPEFVSTTQARMDLTPVISGRYWFITAYVGLYLISPFLNHALCGLKSAPYRRIVALGFVLFSVVPTVSTYTFLYSDYVWFCYLYVLGGFIRLHANDAAASVGITIFNPVALCKKLGATHVLILSLGFMLISTVTRCLASAYLGFTGKPNYFLSANSIPTVLAAVGMFLYFAKCNIGSNRVINAISAATLGVYLIHDNHYVREWLWPHFAWVYQLNPAMLAVALVAIACSVFCVCSLIDLVRLYTLERPLFSFLSKVGNQWFEKADRLENAIQYNKEAL